MCFGLSTLGAGAKTRLESRIKEFTPHCVCSSTPTSRTPQKQIDSKPFAPVRTTRLLCTLPRPVLWIVAVLPYLGASVECGCITCLLHLWSVAVLPYLAASVDCGCITVPWCICGLWLYYLLAASVRRIFFGRRAALPSCLAAIPQLLHMCGVPCRPNKTAAALVLLSAPPSLHHDILCTRLSQFRQCQCQCQCSASAVPVQYQCQCQCQCSASAVTVQCQ